MGADRSSPAPTRIGLTDPRRLDRLLLLVGGGLALLTVAGLARPGGPLVFVNPELDYGFSGFVAGIAAMAMALQWIHYTEERRASAFYLGSALLLLAIANILPLIAVGTGLHTALGLSLNSPGLGPIYAARLTQFLAALLFVMAGLAELRRQPAVEMAGRLTASVAVVLSLGALPLAVALEPWLPALYDLRALPAASQEGLFSGEMAGQTVGGFMAAFAIALLFTVPLLAYRRIAVTTGNRRAASLAVAFLIAIFAQLQSAIVPAVYLGVLSARAAMDGLFYLYLVLAFQSDLGGTIRELRQRREQVEQLREADMTRAIFEERARLAREVHDGLSQELWLAKVGMGEIDEAAGEPHDELGDALKRTRSAIDRAISESRHAILALGAASDFSPDLANTLAAYVEDLADRMGMPVTIDVQTIRAEIPTRTSTQVVRIVQEALSNARKHADARTIRVVLAPTKRGVRVAIEDDGRGIDPDQVAAGHGLRSMRERARSIGGELSFEPNTPGTRVVLEFPIAADAASS